LRLATCRFNEARSWPEDVHSVGSTDAHQDRPAVDQVLAYPGEASADQPFMQELFDKWNAEKNAHSVAEAALGRPAPGSWVC
jgi:hypothetical protein